MIVRKAASTQCKGWITYSIGIANQDEAENSEIWKVENELREENILAQEKDSTNLPNFLV